MRDSRSFLTVGVAAYTVSLYGSQALMSIGFGLAVVLIVAAALVDPAFRSSFVAIRSSLWGSRYLGATLLLVTGFFLSLVGAKFFPVEIGGVRAQARWGLSIGKALYFFWPLLLAAAIAHLSDRRWHQMRRLWLYGFLIVSIFGVIELFTGWNPRGLVETRAHASFGGLFTVNWIFGSYLTYASVMAFPFLVLIESAWRGDWLRSRAFHLTALTVGAVALGGTMSRMLWIALPAGVVFFMLLTLRGRRRWQALAAIALTLAAVTQLPPVKSRLHYARGFSQRTHLWVINWELFKMRPLTGVGWHENLPLAGAYFQEKLPEVGEKFVGHAHSNILEFLGGMGLIGILSWIAWSIVTAGLAYSISPGLFCAFIVFHLNGLTQVNFSETKTLHTVIWCVAFALASQLRGDRLRVDADKPA